MPHKLVQLTDPRVPEEATEWITNAGIDLTTATKYALSYDLDSHRVVIPKYSLDNELVQYQLRNIGLDDGPKYITKRIEGRSLHDPIGYGHESVVICEDMLSAIRIVETYEADAVPLFSSNVKSDELLTAVNIYDRIVVWLDNDNVEVERHADKIALNLRLAGKQVDIVKRFKDPKHYEDSEIISILIGDV